MRLIMIGGGNMGGAIAQALLENEVLSPQQLQIIETHPERRIELEQTLQCQTRDSLDTSIAEFDIVMIAIKPQGASQVMSTLAPFLQEQQLVLSIMAGISCEGMANALGHQRLVRVMPNTPSQAGEGMSVYFSTPEVSDSENTEVHQLLSSYGKALRVTKEDAIDAATAISGSGPAYVFYFAEQMVTQAEQLGFSSEDAITLVEQTLYGGVTLWKQQALPVQELRRRVTSPGGTTEAAIRYFEEQHVGEHLRQGIQKAYQRSKELII